MKIKQNDDMIIVYLYKSDFDINNMEKLNNDIKELFINIIKKYDISMFGYSKVCIYNNENYGNILEIKNIYHSEYNSGIIDLSIKIYKNVPMYLEFDDYFFQDKPKNLLIKNNKYYLKIDNSININKYIEHGEIVY